MQPNNFYKILSLYPLKTVQDGLLVIRRQPLLLNTFRYPQPVIREVLWRKTILIM